MSIDKISVIVPIYNIENYIEQTIESIRNQTYENLEIILVDDGSVDRSGEIADELAQRDSRIVVIHQPNSGVTNARLAGIKASSGQWIGFVDGDDYIEEEMYRVLLDNAIQYQADISHCGYQMVFPSRIDYYHGTCKIIEQDKVRGICDLLEGAIIEPSLCNKLFCKDLFICFDSDSLLDVSVKNYEDFLMNYCLFKNARKSVFFDKCFYHYILRKGSAASSELSEHRLKDPLKVMKIIDNDIQDDSPLKAIIQEKIIRRLIKDASFTLETDDETIISYRKSARQELKRSIPAFINKSMNTKLKIQAIWAGYGPFSYRLIHAFYVKLKSLDKKYELYE